ncbi:glycosyltransferase [Chryseosolibacter indicus]|uniref:Glycosyl transferase family 28 C-terminal domain-containing protein n=1 Tax=Chryseosolibacter indicus TaxID=2782351 RepID=A0ABS5VWR8_9BACT|nr:glycosyltransferase [Chryseosolibacter indicus]MBT1705503.1 hypothetical protein [Chryseosolibacter indicus]
MRVVVAPLDWGFGHATRCIPVIRQLLELRCEVVLAGSGPSLTLLKNEFPHLTSFHLPGYNPKYSAEGSMVWTMALQLLHFVRVIRQEHRVLEKYVSENKVDVVISDNRYGCWSSRVKSIFITHQSNILMPKRFGWLQGVVRIFNERALRKFDGCWIPDDPGQLLSGSLIFYGKINRKINHDYIGMLSRFEFSEKAEIKYDVVAIFSGPEPQRTLLEDTVSAQLQSSRLSYFIVRGVVTPTNNWDSKGADFLTSNELQSLLLSAKVVIARSGYSTIMDLSSLGKKAIFIPTPGQTEQEYLAAKLENEGIAFFMSQHEFNLDVALLRSQNYSGFKPAKKNVLLSKAIAKLFS